MKLAIALSCVLILHAFRARANLTPAKVLESTLKFHPTVLAAIEQMSASEEAARGASGAFDTKLVSDNKIQTKGDWSTTLSRTQIEKPLRLANSKIYVGTEHITNPHGFLAPIYHTGNPTSQTGNYSLVGLKLSLWKNLTINPNSAGLQNARYHAKMAQGEKKLTEWDIGRFAQLAYWERVTARQVKDVYETLLENGETRNEYLNSRSKRGDVAQILVTENEQYVAGRKGALQQARERLMRAEYALSLFYRDEHGAPQAPGPAEIYEDYPNPLSDLLKQEDLNSNIDELISKRPDMKNLAYNVEKSEVNLDLARQDLWPAIDVTGEYFRRKTRQEGMPREYTMVLAQVSIPIEWNLGLGNIASARAHQMVARHQMNLGQQSYKLQVQATRKALDLQLEQVAQSAIEVSKARDLVAAEMVKFKSGGGNLFLVNIREEALASAQASFHQSRLAFMDTFLSYRALVSTAE